MLILQHFFLALGFAFGFLCLILLSFPFLFGIFLLNRSFPPKKCRTNRHKRLKVRQHALLACIARKLVAYLFKINNSILLSLLCPVSVEFHAKKESIYWELNSWSQSLKMSTGPERRSQITLWFIILKFLIWLKKNVVFTALLSKYGFHIRFLCVFFPLLFISCSASWFLTSILTKNKEKTYISKCFKVRQHASLACIARYLVA